ncbi:ABC transporter substrate-binding protein [Pseudorhodobacter turbinis]|uniref:ABC transporter substrate-binding protein n=1 Tax=Pseudorhodobacter turbinis TaxID=2500533 RepID=A0A4P8EH39_9RHOB|nr:ABC transporter substrate-binding protein [Pseudorhodobacter turbinis]QCO55845.1 ABC transporter substrate-binding protein [Pseudorhodobacter turbinis]
MNNKILKLTASAIAICAAAPVFADALTIYTALEEEEVAIYLDAAKTAMPDLEIDVLRLSTGKLGARLLAEAGNPQADVIWGWAVTAMMDPQVLELMAPVEIAGTETLAPEFRDADGRWFAQIGYMGAFCVNTARLADKGLTMPTSWADLAAPEFKDEILMPDPNESGTGYLHVNAVLQALGVEEGWKLLDSVHPNMAQYTSSGSKPCKSARTGEYTVGISLAFTAMQSIEEGYPLAMVFPSEGVGYELEASGVLASSDQKDEAKRFLDWTMSDGAISLFRKHKALVTVAGGEASEAAANAGLPADISTVLAPVDFVESAGRQNEIKAEWREKFGR